MRNIITKNEVKEVKELVVDYYGYSDEWTDSDTVFILEYALGLTENRPDEFMINIINKVFPVSYGLCSNHRTVDTLTKEQFAKIKSGVLRHHMCVDEYMISDMLFIVEYMFGFKDSYLPDEWMKEIIEDVFK